LGVDGSRWLVFVATSMEAESFLRLFFVTCLPSRSVHTLRMSVGTYRRAIATK